VIETDVPPWPDYFFRRGLKYVKEVHGCLVYQGNYIAGGQLANEGLRIAEWLRWSGWAFILEQ